MSLNPARAQRIGNLRDRVTWQTLSLVDNGVELVEMWADTITEHARVEPLKGNEVFAADQVGSRQLLRVFVRFRPSINVAKTRLLWLTGAIVDGQPERLILDIKSATNPDERRRFCELLCQNSEQRAAEGQ